MDSQSPAIPPQPASQEPAKKVLLVEDDKYLASVYQTRLVAEGFDVQWAPDGEAALTHAIAYKPDLILLDIMMPKISGLDALAELRKLPETANTKIIMVSALGQEEDQQKARDLGANDYLVKSQVVIADVVERIRQQLNM